MATRERSTRGAFGPTMEGIMADRFASGSVLDGRYCLDRPIGEGGMGVVWAGAHLITQRRVAIKISKTLSDRGSPSTIDGSRASRRRRFLHEARATTKLDHPAL